MQANVANQLDHGHAISIGQTRYPAEVLARGPFGGRRLRVTSPEGKPYVVANDEAAGRVVCECPHYQHRLKGTDALCKHAAAAIAAGLIDPPPRPREGVDGERVTP